MHSEYLRRLYLNNDLAEGRYEVDGRCVALEDLRVPIFAIGTERDHVSPWRSVYKIHLLTRTEVTFALTSGGHNVGIVNPPGSSAVRGIHYRCTTQPPDGPYLDAERWWNEVPESAGSWWPAWHEWLAAKSGVPVSPLPIGGHGRSRLVPLGEAPGDYVHAT